MACKESKVEGVTANGRPDQKQRWGRQSKKRETMCQMSKEPLPEDNAFLPRL